MPRWLNAGSEIDAASVFLPITVAHRIKSAASTVFLLLGRHAFGRGRRRIQRGFSFGVGSGGCLAYHQDSRNAQILDLVHVPDNLSPDLVAYALLEDRQLVSLAGPDAVTFAQAQFSSDVAALSDSHWQWSAWLTAKGRTIAVFQLIRLSSDALLLVFADGDADAIASQLQRFVFRRKVKITRRDDLQVRAAFAAPQAAVGAAVAGSLEEMLELDLGGADLLRVMRITPTVAGIKTADADAVLTAAWRQADLRLGLPRLVASQREHWTPQQLGLDRLNGYSVRKGCYPGQEIVARTHFLGKAKRALQLLQLSAPAEPGASVEQDGSVLGSIASVADRLALAVLPLETSDGALSVGGEPAQRLPLHDGLAR